MLLTACLGLSGCATALKQEGRCLESLTPDYLKAQQELEDLEMAWQAFALRRDWELNRGGTAYDRSGRSEVEDAYRRLIEARRAHRPLIDWYGKVYTKVRLRMDEEAMLTDLRWALITNPGIVFYPVISWNIHTVMWDGADPDAETDPVVRYCKDRLGPEVAAAPPAGGR
jgi:hypothetical protein